MIIVKTVFLHGEGHCDSLYCIITIQISLLHSCHFNGDSFRLEHVELMPETLPYKTSSYYDKGCPHGGLFMQVWHLFFLSLCLTINGENISP